MQRFALRYALVLAVALVTLPAPVAQSAESRPPDFSGIWQLDDQHSDTPDQLEAALRREARKEQSPSADTGTPVPANNAGSERGRPDGMVRGTHGGGMGGGRHGGHRGKGADRKASSSHAPTHYATPSWLDDDGVLIVQQDKHGLQIRLDSGTQLALHFGAPPQQMLNGSALVRCQRLANGVRVEMTFADGSVLTQDWLRDTDGLTLRQAWRLPELERPVTFARRYRKLD